MSRMDADLFRTFRKHKNLSYRDLAKLIRTTPQRIKAIEDGTGKLSLSARETLFAMIEAEPLRVLGFNARGQAKLKREIASYPWRKQTEIEKCFGRFAAKHFRDVRDSKLFCTCVMCAEARLTYASLILGEDGLETLVGGICYFNPMIVWLCRHCSHRWTPKNLDYPQQCPHCQSPDWNGKTLERTDNGKPEDDGSGNDLLHNRQSADGTPEARSVHQ